MTPRAQARVVYLKSRDRHAVIVRDYCVGHFSYDFNAQECADYINAAFSSEMDKVLKDERERIAAILNRHKNEGCDAFECAVQEIKHPENYKALKRGKVG